MRMTILIGSGSLGQQSLQNHQLESWKKVHPHSPQLSIFSQYLFLFHLIYTCVCPFARQIHGCRNQFYRRPPSISKCQQSQRCLTLRAFSQRKRILREGLVVPGIEICRHTQDYLVHFSSSSVKNIVMAGCSPLLDSVRQRLYERYHECCWKSTCIIMSYMRVDYFLSQQLTGSLTASKIEPAISWPLLAESVLW